MYVFKAFGGLQARRSLSCRCCNFLGFKCSPLTSALVSDCDRRFQKISIENLLITFCFFYRPSPPPLFPLLCLYRIETLSSGLRDVGKRVDYKADAMATERALEEKSDKVNTKPSRCFFCVFVVIRHTSWGSIGRHYTRLLHHAMENPPYPRISPTLKALPPHMV